MAICHILELAIHHDLAQILHRARRHLTHLTWASCIGLLSAIFFCNEIYLAIFLVFPDAAHLKQRVIAVQVTLCYAKSTHTLTWVNLGWWLMNVIDGHLGLVHAELFYLDRHILCQAHGYASAPFTGEVFGTRHPHLSLQLLNLIFLRFLFQLLLCVCPHYWCRRNFVDLLGIVYHVWNFFDD